MTPFHLAAFLGSTALNSAVQNRANKINIAKYEEMKRYNSPSAQMSRFRRAGLNPHLIYTQQNTVDAPPAWNPPAFEFGHLAESASDLKVDKELNLLDNQIIAETLKNEYQGIINKYQDELSSQQLESVKQSIEQTKKNIQKIVADTSKVAKETELLQKRYNLDAFKTQFDAIMRNKQFQLDLDKFGLDKSRFEEVKRQFNIQHKYDALIYDFLSGIAGKPINQAGKEFGAFIRKFIISILTGT